VNRRQFLHLAGAASVAMSQRFALGKVKESARRPNILFCISDDQTWLHCSAYGSKMVKTPHFDRVASEGVLFSNAFVSVPSCNPSRSSVLTGMPFYRLKEACMNHTPWVPQLRVYTDMLSENGYHVGFTGKGCGPTDWKVAGRNCNPAGTEYNRRVLQSGSKGIANTDYARNFEGFLEKRPKGSPFCFWYGGRDPHRVFKNGIGLREGKRLADAEVPPFYPDSQEIRSDLLDYAVHIEWFDRHLGPVKKDSPTSPGAMGFDEWLSHDNYFELNPVLSRNGEAPQKIEGEGSEIIIDEAIKFIQKSENQNRPFLVVVWFGSPHDPFLGLPEDLALYENLPDSLSNKEVSVKSKKTLEKVKRPLRDVLQERYAEITAMDRSIGKLRSYLKENGLKENTLVWYCGDNGPPGCADRTAMTLRGQKGDLYEGGVRVPGVLEWPAGIKASASTSAISVTSDILPTLSEIIGQPLPDRPLDGISLIPFFNDPAKQRTEPLYFWKFNINSVFDESSQPYIDPKLQEGTTPNVAGKYERNFRNLRYSQVSEEDFAGTRTMMKNQFKLIVEGRSPNEKGFELYDIQNDPGETKNLAHEHPEIVEKMLVQLRKWQESVLNSLTGADYN